MPIECLLKMQCGGCPWIAKSSKHQKQETLENLQLLALAHNLSLPEIKYIRPADFGLRDRVDLTLYQGRLGLYDLDRNEILDIQQCPQMSDSLHAWFLDFRKILPKIELGSLRLRVSPSGQRGIWLDFPNIEIKKLLDDKVWLQELHQICQVEIGQRRKKLSLNTFKLKEGEDQIWFETYLADQSAFPLYSQIASFTQTGFVANRVLMKNLFSLLAPLQVQSALELCSGIGNFSFALASTGMNVKAVEWDQRSLRAFETSLNYYEHSERIQIERLNIYRKTADLENAFHNVDLILVDPPRSGLKACLDVLASIQMPEYFIYVSCFAQSLLNDCQKLTEMGYQIEEFRAIDQFPQSPHCEYMLLLKRS